MNSSIANRPGLRPQAVISMRATGYDYFDENNQVVDSLAEEYVMLPVPGDDYVTPFYYIAISSDFAYSGSSLKAWPPKSQRSSSARRKQVQSRL